ncbi:transposase [Arthrobacter sp. TWP1-1]|uniref:transposase n=1 Tax=Arthrobacter sp. TWP1-1 TaxID=2804568 RepID=UPI003CF2C3EA
MKEQVRTLLRTGSLEDAELAKEDLEHLEQESNQPETTTLWRTMCRWWKEIEVLIVTGATTGKVEANNASTSNTSNAPVVDSSIAPTTQHVLCSGAPPEQR